MTFPDSPPPYTPYTGPSNSSFRDSPPSQRNANSPNAKNPTSRNRPNTPISAQSSSPHLVNNENVNAQIVTHGRNLSRLSQQRPRDLPGSGSASNTQYRPSYGSITERSGPRVYVSNASGNRESRKDGGIIATLMMMCCCLIPIFILLCYVLSPISFGGDTSHRPAHPRVPVEFEKPILCNPRANIPYDPYPDEWRVDPIYADAMSVDLRGYANGGIVVDHDPTLCSLTYRLHYHVSDTQQKSRVNASATVTDSTFELVVSTPDHRDVPIHDCIAVAIHILIPSSLSKPVDLKIHANNADVDVRNLGDTVLGHVDISIVNGNTSVEYLRAQTTNLTTVTGNVAIQQLAAQTTSLNTTTGSITGTFYDISWFTARTTTGFISTNLNLPTTEATIHTKTKEGNIRLVVSDNFRGRFHAISQKSHVYVHGDNIKILESGPRWWFWWRAAYVRGNNRGGGEGRIKGETWKGDVDISFDA